jgi:serine/threonine-protein kinase
LLVNPANTRLPAATPMVALGAALDSEIDGMAQVYVPTGRFQMGSTDADLAPVLQSCPGCSFSAEQPQHTVTLDAYWIDQTDVTNAMFAQFVAATGYKTEAEKAGTGSVFNPDSKQWEDKAGADWRHPGGPEDSNSRLDAYPVVQVTWPDANAYCAWAGRRLPTEAEWEKAARGTDGRRYPWGNTPAAGNRLNFADLSLSQLWVDQSVNDGFAYASPVGHYPDGVSPYGALDMAGNVWQWTADWFSDAYYAAWPAVNPTGPEQGSARVVRGGSWLNQAINVRAAYRYGSPPSTRSTSTGFRCARTPDAVGLGVLATPTATPG